MRIRWGILTPVLSCVVLLTAYESATSSARPAPSQVPEVRTSTATAGANELAPGEFSFTTGLDKVPQYIRGPVKCDTRDDVYRIAIGDPDSGGVELGLSQDESVLKYADLGNRNGVYLALVDNGNDDSEAHPSLHKTGSTYSASGYATGMTDTQEENTLYFEISVACP